MPWQENGRFYYAALLPSDTPGHPAKSQTQTAFAVSYRTFHEGNHAASPLTARNPRYFSQDMTISTISS